LTFKIPRTRTSAILLSFLLGQHLQSGCWVRVDGGITSLEMLTVDEFFAIATAEEDWHDQDERETAKRFQNLVSILKQNLSQLQVYRVDSIDIDAYIVGVTDGGELAGLSTKLVET